MGFFGRLFGFGQSQPGSPPQGMRAHLRGSGAFALPIVGESYYQEALEAICGPRSDEGEDRRVEARLVLENDNPHDSMAVRVDIQGQTVGHLSREHARQYRNQLERAGYASTDAYCKARIRGGWDRGEGRQGYYGVFLDLPMDDSTATSYRRMAQNERGRSFATRLDDHGQPTKALYGPRVAKRLVSELLGLSVRAWSVMVRFRRANWPLSSGGWPVTLTRRFSIQGRPSPNACSVSTRMA